MSIDEVDDIELLRKAAKILEAENLEMAKLIAQLKRELFEMKHGKPEQLKLQIAELEDKLAKRNKMLFGEKSEKRGSHKNKEPKKQTGHGRREQPQLDVGEQTHVADFNDERCDLCGGELHAADGFFEESEEIDIVERKFVLKKHRRQKYKCQCGSCIKAAPGPLKLFDGARYSVGFALHVAIAKYADHLPLERQARSMSRDGLIVDSQTLWDQIDCLADYLQPAYERLQSYILTQPVIGVDETRWKLLAAKNKNQGGRGKVWQIWAICCPDAAHYSFEDSRSVEAAKTVLGDYSGTILTDGYVSYESLKKSSGRFEQAYCWAHVRRKFFEIKDQQPEKCERILDLIGELYAVEKDAREGPPDEVLALRKERSKPIITAIQHWMLETEAFPESPLGKAIKYMAKRWDGLRLFLDDANVSLDNNATERALRGLVVGRKNHYGSRSVRGTQVAAILYSLIESAKLAGVGVHTYLQTAINAALRGDRIPLPHETG